MAGLVFQCTAPASPLSLSIFLNLHVTPPLDTSVRLARATSFWWLVPCMPVRLTTHSSRCCIQSPTFLPSSRDTPSQDAMQWSPCGIWSCSTSIRSRQAHWWLLLSNQLICKSIFILVAHMRGASWHLQGTNTRTTRRVPTCGLYHARHSLPSRILPASPTPPSWRVVWLPDHACPNPQQASFL